MSLKQHARNTNPEILCGKPEISFRRLFSQHPDKLIGQDDPKEQSGRSFPEMRSRIPRNHSQQNGFEKDGGAVQP